MYMGIKTYQEKNKKPMEKELAQSEIPVRRKIPSNEKQWSNFANFLQIFIQVSLLTNSAMLVLIT